MKRSDFLKGMGILGAGSMIPFKSVADTDSAAKTTACVLIPNETEGPFPLDLTTNNAATYFRQDIREDRTGIKLTLKLRIIGINNCGVMQNVRVNVWHCDRTGLYSGYNNNQNQGDVNATFLRGYQMTDANGEVTFTTIFPGHYSGRVTHIHFQVYVSSIYKAVSQLTFDVASKQALYSANSSLYNGTDPATLASDNVFSDGYSNQIATLTANGDGSYSSFMEVGINATGATGLANYEGETGGQFRLGQNYPNPYRGFTTVPVTLASSSEVALDIYDLNARKVAHISKGTLPAGDYRIEVDCSSLGISTGSYLYQIQVSNENGVFRQAKMMTAAL